MHSITWKPIIHLIPEKKGMIKKNKSIEEKEIICQTETTTKNKF
jgi:hypothetical protein